MSVPAPLCRWIAAAAVLVGAAADATAQAVTGSAIQGQVLGPDSAPVVEATILVTNGSNGERWRTSSMSGGRYLLEHLSVGGPYQLAVRALGFEPATRDGIFLSLGQRLRLDFVLHPGATLLEPLTVRVVDDPLINPGRTGPSQIIAESTLTRLPISGRNLLGVASLSPLVTGSGSVAGLNDRLTTVQIDGAVGGDLLGGVITPGQALGLRTVAVEAVKEVQVLAAPFDVRFGTFAAGLVNAVTKSGSNRFAGSVVGYYTGPALQGKDETGSRGDDFVLDEASLTLGGPIARDRAAFFVEAGLQHGRRPINTPIIGPDSTGGADSLGIGFRRASVTRLQEVMRDTYGVEAGNDRSLSGERGGRQCLRQGHAAAGGEQPAGCLARIRPQHAGSAGRKLPDAGGVLPRLHRLPPFGESPYHSPGLGRRHSGGDFPTTCFSPGPGSGRPAGPLTSLWSSCVPARVISGPGATRSV